ncbi:threonine/serine dehydratase [Rhodospirillaceae bacterium SYSU D60014]|uniref:threonine ammonia-lyase n=1 Tax=Virgifigura deserti TaxID=2268457 RepID=UPI000E6681D2
MVTPPTVDEIAEMRARLGDRIVETPVHRWRSADLAQAVGPETDVLLKLELFQHTGTFKPRGALSVMLNLPDEQAARGVTAVSAGNHAIAVAYAARLLGTSAKVVMPKTASPFRVERCKQYGAEVVLADTIAAAFDTVRRIEETEGLTLVHPFEGPFTVLGTATLGWELCRQAGDALDAVIIPIGGGGLSAGVSSALKAVWPECRVFGVEPEGAPTLSKSFAAGEPMAIDRVDTIADSLGAPYAMPLTFGILRRNLERIVLVDDDALRRAMHLLFRDMKLAVEPAGAAATAALMGPLRDELRGKRVGLIVCGANIDTATYARHIGAAEQALSGG